MDLVDAVAVHITGVLAQAVAHRLMTIISSGISGIDVVPARVDLCARGAMIAKTADEWILPKIL